MSRADIANFLVRQITDDTYHRATPAISNYTVLPACHPTHRLDP